MCGISGIRRYGDKPIEEIMIRSFLLGLEHRGNDATGIAMQRKDGEVLVYKDDIAAWTFVKSKGYENFLNEHLNDDIIQVILHTRAATKGNPRKNINNHPLHAGKAAVVHNGVLNNDDALFRELELERNAETDSDILRAIVDKFGVTKEAIRKLNKVRGGAAIAALHPEYPGLMLLGRSGNPLTQASNGDFFCFASEKNIIHKAMRPWVSWHKKWFQFQSLQLAFSPYPDNTLEILGPDGTEWHDEFKAFWGTYHEPVRRVYSGWKERQRTWDKQAEHSASTSSTSTSAAPIKVLNAERTAGAPNVVVECPNCKKRWALSADLLDVPRHLLECTKARGGCGGRLGQYNPTVRVETSEHVSVN